MKLHLPLTLLTAVLAAFIALPAQAVEAPVGYDSIYLPRNASLEDYATLSADEHLAFLLRNSAVITPDNNPHWGGYDSSTSPSYTTLINGGNLFFGSNNSSSPVALSFKDVDRNALAFYHQKALTFDTLSNLTFSNIDGSAIALAYDGSDTRSALTITNINDSQDGTVDVLFENMRAYAIYADSGNVNLSNNGDVSFRENGDNAIYNASSVTISSNANVTFSGNGDSAIYNASSVTISSNASVTFSGNVGYYNGGAIYATTLTINDNGDVTFSGNSISHNYSTMQGGAIRASSLNISNNANVIFSGNSATREYYEYDYECRGGAIYSNNELTIDNNADVTFSGNSCSGVFDEYYNENNYTGDGYNCYVPGGAIYAGDAIAIRDNRDVTFSNNSASSVLYAARGGAIYANNDLSITNNANVTFSGNSVSGVCNLQDYYSDGNVLGGAIYAYDTLSIDNNNGAVTFSGNSASGVRDVDATPNNEEEYTPAVCGGAIYAYGSLTISNNNGAVTFSGNSASGVCDVDATPNNEEGYTPAVFGGAIYAYDTLSIDNNKGAVTFSGNSTSGVRDVDATPNNEEGYTPAVYGGAIYAYGSLTISNNNGAVTFSENTSVAEGAIAYGGAIYACRDLAINDNGDVLFSKNSSVATFTADEDSDYLFKGEYDSDYVNYESGISSYGGAIYLDYSYNSPTSISGNTSVTFSGNYTSSTHTASDEHHIHFNANVYDEYYNNASAYGGAIYSRSSLRIENNGDVTFSGNYAAASSSFEDYSNEYYDNRWENLDISYRDRYTLKAYSYGGAIYIGGSSNTLAIENNNKVSFQGNYTVTTNTDHYSYDDNRDFVKSSYGGAIYVNEGGNKLTINNNNEVSFNENHASVLGNSGRSYGGAIYNDGTVNISNNNNVSFLGNHASVLDSWGYSYGGAIYNDGTIDINNNGAVRVIGNYAEDNSYGYCYGGAIYNNGRLNIKGNDSVLFEKNYEHRGDSYCLRSIYQSSGNMNLSAKTGGNITFYDSVYLSGTTYFNSDYTDAEGNTQSAKGDIIISGKYAEQHLNEILAANNENRTATAEEIQNSRTSYISHLYLENGTLQVVDGVQLNTRHLRVNGEAKLLLRDSVIASAYDYINTVTFATGTEMELQGINSVTSHSLTLSTGTTLTASLTDTNLQQAALSLSGTLYTEGTLTLNLNVESEHAKGMYQIISLSDSTQYDVSGWTAENISFHGSGAAEGAGFGDLMWQDGVLYYVASPLWSNASGSGVWSSEDTNWNSGSAFREGQDVLFSDIGAGTVQLSGDIAPESININNSSDYLFTAAEGGGRLVGSTGITKMGAGALAIATANAHTGNTELLGGTINVQHSTALGATAEGKAALISAEGTTVTIENGSQVVLAAEGNDIAGAVEIAEGATLVMKGGNYAASNSTVNGTLRFDGFNAAAGDLTGNGQVLVKDSSVSFSNSSAYTGDLSVKGSAAELTLAKGGYRGNGTVEVQGGKLTLENRSSITINEGGQLAVSDEATVQATNVNILEGATLSIGDVSAVVELNSLMSGSEMAVYTTAAAEGYDPTVAVHTAVGGVLETNSLNLFGGSALVANGAHIDLSGAYLTIDTTEDAKIDLVLTLGANYTPDSQVVLFSNVGGIDLYYDGFYADADEGIVYTLNAGDYFTGEWINENTTLTYDTTANVVYLQGVSNVVPEPTTATLSLLALAALAMRRRRK